MTYRVKPTKTFRGPLFSIEAHGWLGGKMYAKRAYIRGVWFEPKHVVVNPYPISLLPSIHIPYSFWNRGIHGTYKIPAFGLHPYPAFISQYYSPMGWCYQRRRTWHGITWSPMKPPVSVQPNTGFQHAWKGIFHEGMYRLSLLTDAQKLVYNNYTYPKAASGANRFMSEFLKETYKEFKNWADSRVGWNDWQTRWGAGIRPLWSDTHVSWSNNFFLWA